jgi:cation diffusion facilitator family transporter
MASGSSRKVVYAAIAANIGIALGKYAAALFTGSSSMLAEAFHSTVDSGNELLLLLGMRRSERPPDAGHPFGHGKEVYFWSLLVAIFIFGIGGGFSLYEGFTRLIEGQAPTGTKWNYIVLALAALLEGYSWWVSRRELVARKKPHETIWQCIQRSKDPTVFTVFIEDSAALAGIALAFLGITLTQVTGNPAFDAVGSIAVGLLLAVVAVMLAMESRKLLVGERADTDQINRVREVIAAEPAVERVGDLLTMQLGPEEVLLNVAIKFRRGQNVQDLETTIDNLERRIRAEEPSIKRIFIEAESLRSQPSA